MKWYLSIKSLKKKDIARINLIIRPSEIIAESATRKKDPLLEIEFRFVSCLF